MKERNKAVPAVYLFLRRGEEILLMRRQGSGYYDGWYSVPAGHVEAGELPLEGLVREVHEELGITINENDARLVHTMYCTKHIFVGGASELLHSPQDSKVLKVNSFTFNAKLGFVRGETLGDFPGVCDKAK